MLLKNLEELGLTKGQIKVYSAILELGMSSLHKIQEKTGLERRGIYDVIGKLIEKGLVTYTEERGGKTFQCTHPNKIKEEIEKKRTVLSDLENQVPQITALFESAKPRVRAEVFRGAEALKALLDESLEHKACYWIGGNSSVEKTQLKIWFKHWMQRRVQKKCMMYDLVDYGTSLEGLKPNDVKAHKKNYYKYCSLPRELASPMVIFIFGNKVAQILWSESFAFVIESEKVKDSFMKYFQYFWKET